MHFPSAQLDLLYNYSGLLRVSNVTLIVRWASSDMWPEHTVSIAITLGAHVYIKYI